MPVCYCKSLNKISRKTQPEENAIEHSKILVTLSLRVKWEETQSLHNINFPIERARKVLVSAFIPIQKYTSLYCLLSHRDGPGPVARNIPLLWALAWAACECLYFLCSRHRLLSQMWDQTNISKFILNEVSERESEWIFMKDCFYLVLNFIVLYFPWLPNKLFVTWWLPDTAGVGGQWTLPLVWARWCQCLPGSW